MKSLLYTAYFTIFTLLATTAQAQSPEDVSETLMSAKGVFCPKKIMLPAGTTLILELAEAVAASAVTPGKVVQMRVRTDVRAEGKTLVRTGCQAIGRVKSIQAGTHNEPERLTIELYYVLSVDGQQLALHGNEQTFVAPTPNEPAMAPVNTLFTAHLMNNEEINSK